MKISKIDKILLVISGLIAAVIGALILFSPVTFYASYDIVLGDNMSLLNEIRAPGGALFASGMLIIAGAFFEKLTYTSIVVSALLYLSYGLSRVVSILIDGMPVDGLVQATVLEIVIGFVCLFILMKHHTQHKLTH